MNIGMHMADGLISVPVGFLFYVVIVGFIAVSLKQLKNQEVKQIPMMAVMGAFVFAAQMINFTIPGTGSSGHIVGSILLCIILGQYAGFLSIVSVLIIQCLLFGDGGLLALGCNIFNMGILPCFVAYPFIVKPLINKHSTVLSSCVCVLGCLVGLELGALSVSVQTLVSGISALPFIKFVGLMMMIHFFIGIVEGLITALVVHFVQQQSPQYIHRQNYSKKTTVILGVLAIVIAGGLSILASSYPDGLEWSIQSITGSTELENKGTMKEDIEKIQEKTSLFSDYLIDGKETLVSGSSAGVIGIAATFMVIGGIGYISTRKHRNE